MADQLACSYAALLLHDANIAISSKKIEDVVKAAGLEVRPTLPILYANFFAKKSVAALFVAAASSGSAATAPAAPVAAAAGAGAEKKPDAKKKEEPKEEDDNDMGFGLFD